MENEGTNFARTAKIESRTLCNISTFKILNNHRLLDFTHPYITHQKKKKALYGEILFTIQPDKDEP